MNHSKNPAQPKLEVRNNAITVKLPAGTTVPADGRLIVPVVDGVGAQPGTVPALTDDSWYDLPQFDTAEAAPSGIVPNRSTATPEQQSPANRTRYAK